ncbi:30S ribosome-binding factor RbfA [Paenibacillus sp. SEL3]|jgi:ribosome-binding factor A|uniref:Ribosome-binding factor A n=4 Tax=Paenibacillus TaxID=44249 RepID=A0A074L977_PAEPO|nr:MULTISPECIES: 30S ribosome-binding factor RbfA [Paenibacillus]KAF6637646.1 30S ribosome-binding factor RbfA [Paenibacillus sp. EKM208P]MCF2718652.1 30S ribosome-binding factor RbfA [Paenibacillus sp. UKAQ_18]ADM69768.1 ribosome-binding factor A [Paenibacillus polymyxa E681]AHC19630.1 ribosome-binding factor A [Paenibacillus polymyxa CR1]ALA41901.1 ribosome-binding factor A [Paenibacillus peoriae]
MAKIRTGRVGEQIKKELSQLIQTELKDPRIGFITVTGVDLTNDLSQAKIYLSVLGDEEQKNSSLKALDKANGYLRSELGKRIRLRHIPELIFKIDESIAYGSRIEKLLSDIDKDEK